MESVSEDNQVSSRIPAHVFAPTSATSQAEWSTASNESLFSIHMGNTSFNESSLMSKSGELDSPIMASPLFDFPVTSATPTAREDAAAAETMREVLREKECQQNKNVDKETDLGRSMSQFSDASGKSFAFPILTEEEEKKNNTEKKGAHKKKESSSQLSSGNTTPEYTAPPETPMAETPKSPIPKAIQNGGPRRWFTCFSCFPSCHEETTNNATLEK